MPQKTVKTAAEMDCNGVHNPAPAEDKEAISTVMPLAPHAPCAVHHAASL